MKIHKQEATFQPIAIILESQEEVDVITAVFANISVTEKYGQKLLTSFIML